MKSLMYVLGAIMLASALLVTAVAVGAIWLHSGAKDSHGPDVPEAPTSGVPVKPSDIGAEQPSKRDPGVSDPETAPKPTDGVIAIGNDEKDGVTLELTGLTRTDDGCLKVSFRFRNTTDKPTLIWGKEINSLKYVDPNTKAVYAIMVDYNGKILPSSKNPGGKTLSSDPGYIRISANNVSKTYWAKLAGPDEGVQKVTFYFDNFEPIEGVALPPAK